MLLSSLRRLLDGLFIRPLEFLVLRSSYRVDALGLPIYVDSEYPAPVVEMVREALALLARVDPIRWKHARRDLGCIYCKKLGRVGAHYDDRIRACVLSVEKVLAQPVLNLAASVVHEAAHACLNRHSSPARDFAERVRSERFCVRAQLNFLARLPANEDVASLMRYYRSVYGRVAEEPWFTDAHYYDDFMAEVRTLDLPRWVRNLLERLARRRYGVAPSERKDEP
jgi:hypothetical protein